TNCYKGVGLTLIPFLNSSYGNAIIGNSIYNNQQLGIDIDSDDLVEPIDTNQTIGNNGDIDFPLILTAWNCGVNNFTHVGFEFYSNNAFPGYRVEFYSNSVSDGSGHGEGEVYLGDWVFDPDTNVDTISIDLGQTLPVGTIITATITGTLLNTSEFSLNYLVTDPPVFDPPTTLEETCLGAANAEIYIDAPEAYYFSIDGFLTQTYGINGDTLIDLASGTYNVEAKYLNGCVLSQPVTLAPGPELPFAVTVVPDTCGLNVGYLLIDTVLTNAAGGTGDYIYTFDGSTFNGNIDMINVAAGNYDIGLMDTSLGCNSLITQYNVPEITDVVDESFSFDDFCLADTPIPYNIATSGGSWVFNPAVTDGATIDVNSGEIFNAVTGNSYTVEYTVGICNESSSAVVTAAPVEDGSFVYDPFCIGLTPSITVTESGGAWSFNPDPGTASIDPSTGEITGTGGTYMVQYVTGGTCPDTVVNAVITYDSPSAPITTITDSIYCPDDQIQAIQAPAGTSLSYSWYDDVALTMLLDTGDSFIPSLLAVGPNDFYVVMSDANGCNSEAGKVNYYLVDTSPMFASIDIDVCVGSEVELDAQGGIVYSWSVNSQITGDLNVSTTTAKILTPDNFIVKITDAFGCVVIDTVHIGLLSPDQCEVVVYNAYSPNNDGVNDFWEIDGIEGFPENTVVIYNRWGDVIIQFENYNNSDVIWGGENKSGGIVPAGTYYFVVEVGGEQDQAGWVQILR
ncbi:MAG: gliding motility-associated C-terminal domain-containing protein, partial [Crocinitomicaceae bacterium]|nr:gliding motility-associated C-terminal domain-containing protein [Crocinitomicaceae bacterium]